MALGLAATGLILLQDKIARGDRTPGVVKPREDPLVTLRGRRDEEPKPAKKTKAAARPATPKVKAAPPPPPPEADDEDEDDDDEDEEGEDLG